MRLASEIVRRSAWSSYGLDPAQGFTRSDVLWGYANEAGGHLGDVGRFLAVALHAFASRVAAVHVPSPIDLYDEPGLGQVEVGFEASVGMNAELALEEDLRGFKLKRKFVFGA